MEILKRLRRKLTDDRLKNLNPDSSEFTEMHHEILSERKYMQDVFRGFYDEIINCDKRFFSAEGKVVEIGAGSSFIKKYYPSVITSDIKLTPYTDMVIDALAMPFADNSLRAVYGIHCFHHFADPDKFFTELVRVLIPGGGCILIDPHYSWMANKFYKALTDEEIFDKKMNGWKSGISGPMKGANQALSYIIFKRDVELFHKKFPELEIVFQKTFTNYLRYFVAGGLNFKPLLAYSFRHVIKVFEFLLLPFRRLFAVHHIIVIRKKSSVK